MTLIEKINQQTENIKALTMLWMNLLPAAPLPSPAQFDVWLDLHNVEDVVGAIKATANKYNQLKGKMDQDYTVRYCSACANSRKTSRNEVWK